jgi:predicted GIY-YIG superfamily endonuclease
VARCRPAPPRSNDANAPPAARPLRGWTASQLHAGFEQALAGSDGAFGAHCVHELWMRGEFAINVEHALERLWKHAADSIPEWLPMRHIEWLPLAYEVAQRMRAAARGRSHIYLVLLDYADSRPEPHGVYVGMTHYRPAQRFDQHKAGIRAAGSVLRRGLELLAGPTMHLQYIARAEALRIEGELAEALRAAGLFVQGGH